MRKDKKECCRPKLNFNNRMVILDVATRTVAGIVQEIDFTLYLDQIEETYDRMMMLITKEE